MRSIRFRAWHKRYNRFIVLEKIHFGENGPKAVYERDELSPTTPYIYSIEWVELMAYTGLKDQNGREIYEGDILRFSNGNIGKVFWSNLRSGFDVAFNGAIPEELDVRLADRSEVVGNIYKNKELLDE